MFNASSPNRALPYNVTEEIQNAVKNEGNKSDAIVKLSKEDVDAAKDRATLKRKHKEVALEKRKKAKAKHDEAEKQVQVHTFAI